MIEEVTVEVEAGVEGKGAEVEAKAETVSAPPKEGRQLRKVPSLCRSEGERRLAGTFMLPDTSSTAQCRLSKLVRINSIFWNC